MKRLGILFIFVVAAVWFFLRSERREEVPMPPPLVRSTPQGRPTPPPVRSAPIKTVVKNESAPTKAETKLIKFKVVDGMAVAFGDLILGEPEHADVAEGHFDPPNPQLWDRPEIPYQIHPDLPEPARVKQALAYLREHTRINFVPYEDQADVIVFEPWKENCYSLLGRAGGRQPIRLGPKCDSSAVLHEIMHALGFVHEQSRPDRDKYVEVIWDNIDDKHRDQFEAVPNAFMAANGDAPFDYHSLMLYSPGMFAKTSGAPTMRTRTAAPIAPTTRGLSPGDLARLRRLYGEAE